MNERDTVLSLSRTILAVSQGSVHYREIYERIQDQWGYTGHAKDPALYVYAYLYHAAKESGPWVFFCGKGRFALEPPQTPPAQRTASATAVRPDAVNSRRRTEEVPHTCGTCASIHYAGMKVITHESGQCDSDKSGLTCVRPDRPACPYWRRRSFGSVQLDLKEQRAATALIEDLNMGKVNNRKKRKRFIQGGRDAEED